MRTTIAVLTLLAVSCSRPAHSSAGAVAPRPDSYGLEMGKVTYQRYCSGCHGESGAGDGFNAFNLDPHPRDLGDPAFQKSRTNQDLADAIRRGGAGVGLSSLMPPWGKTINEREVNDVILYIRSMRR